MRNLRSKFWRAVATRFSPRRDSQPENAVAAEAPSVGGSVVSEFTPATLRRDLPRILYTREKEECEIFFQGLIPGSGNGHNLYGYFTKEELIAEIPLPQTHLPPRVVTAASARNFSRGGSPFGNEGINYDVRDGQSFHTYIDGHTVVTILALAGGGECCTFVMKGEIGPRTVLTLGEKRFPEVFAALKNAKIEIAQSIERTFDLPPTPNETEYKHPFQGYRKDLGRPKNDDFVPAIKESTRRSGLNSLLNDLAKGLQISHRNSSDALSDESERKNFVQRFIRANHTSLMSFMVKAGLAAVPKNEEILSELAMEYCAADPVTQQEILQRYGIASPTIDKLREWENNQARAREWAQAGAVASKDEGGLVAQAVPPGRRFRQSMHDLGQAAARLFGLGTSTAAPELQTQAGQEPLTQPDLPDADIHETADTVARLPKPREPREPGKRGSWRVGVAAVLLGVVASGAAASTAYQVAPSNSASQASEASQTTTQAPPTQSLEQKSPSRGPDLIDENAPAPTAPLKPAETVVHADLADGGSIWRTAKDLLPIRDKDLSDKDLFEISKATLERMGYSTTGPDALAAARLVPPGPIDIVIPHHVARGAQR